MRTSIRPFVTTGIALVGAVVITVAPLAPPPPAAQVRVASPDIELTAVIPDEIFDPATTLYAALAVYPLADAAQALANAPLYLLFPVGWLANGATPAEVLRGVATLPVSNLLRTAITSAEILSGLNPPLGDEFFDLSGRLTSAFFDLADGIPDEDINPFPEGTLRDATNAFININDGFGISTGEAVVTIGSVPIAVVRAVNNISEGGDPAEEFGWVADTLLSYFPAPGIGGGVSYAVRDLVENLPAPIGQVDGVVDTAYKQFHANVITPLNRALIPSSTTLRQTVETSTQFTGGAVDEVPQGNNVVSLRADEPEQPRKRPLLDLVRNSTMATPGGTTTSAGRPGDNLREAVRGVTTAVNDIRDGIREGVQRVSDRLKGDRDDEGSGTQSEATP